MQKINPILEEKMKIFRQSKIYKLEEEFNEGLKVFPLNQKHDYKLKDRQRQSEQKQMNTINIKIGRSL
jgi:hypothetical protein